MPKLSDLLERRSSLVVEMRSINDKAEKEKREYTAEEDKRHKDLKTEVAGLDTQIERARDLQEAERSAPAIVHAGNIGDGRYEDRARKFSLLKMINARIGEDVDVGFEREISGEVVRRSGRKFTGIPVPDEYFQVEKRTLLVGSSAATVYPSVHRDDLFIDVLRARLVTGRLGATVLDNLVGTNDVPRQTGSSQAQWVAEDGSLSETDMTLDDITLAPKTVGCVTSYSRRTLINALPSIENLVRNDLAAVIANAIDNKAMLGDGTGNTPVGIINAPSVGVATLVTPSWAEVLNFIAAVQLSNADIGSLGWALSPAAVKKLRSTLVASSTDSAMIMPTPNALAGYPAETTTALHGLNSPDRDTVIFGAWSQLMIAYWSGVDILANPYETTAYLKGRVQLRAMRDVDVAVRHGQSFAKATDLQAP